MAVDDDRIAPLSEIPADSTLLFTVRDGFDEEEAVLVRTDDGVAAWRNYCQHWTDVRLDRGEGAAMRGDELVCQKHGALFECDTGRCTHGPCEGAVLDAIEVRVEAGAVYLSDDRYEFVERGGTGDYDRSANRSLGFD